MGLDQYLKQKRKATYTHEENFQWLLSDWYSKKGFSVTFKPEDTIADTFEKLKKAYISIDDLYEFTDILEDYVNDRLKNGVVESDELIYWRKANWVRQWFVNHGYDSDANCEEFPVTKDMLEELLDDCLSVLANHDRAAELLPTSSGFFFGDTDYDESYFAQVERTAEELTDVLENIDFEAGEVYYYEWW